MDVRNVRQRLRPLTGLFGPSWGSVGPLMRVLGRVETLFGHFGPVLEPTQSLGHSRHGCQNCPATLAALHDTLGPFLGLCWALAGPLGPSWDALGPFWGCFGGRADSPDTADMDEDVSAETAISK